MSERVWSGRLLELQMRALSVAADIHSRAASAAHRMPVPAGLERALWWIRGHARDEWWVAGLAAALSIAAYAWYDAQGLTIAFNDARIRELIARRVLIGRTPGLAQLGTTWLPLGSILMLPFVWNDSMFRDGIAGSLPSMAAYVVASVYMFRLGRALTSSRAAGWVAAVALMLNPSLLYMQSTAMSETASITALVAATYYALQVVQTYRAADVVKVAMAAAAGTLIRYENWMIALALVPILGYAAWRHRGRLLAESWTILYAMLAFVGCVAWVLYNAVIFHDPLTSFFYGSSTHSYNFPQEVAPGRHNPIVAFLMYGYTIIGTVGWLVAALAVIGLVLFVWRERLRVRALSAYLVLAPFVFYWTVLVVGANTERLPLFGTGNQGYYNVRFGLLMIPAAALFAAVLTSRFPAWPRRLAAVGAPLLVVVSGAVGLAPAASGQTPVAFTLETPYVEREVLQGAGAGGWQIGQQEAEWFSGQYRGGNVLLTYPTDPSLMFYLLTKDGFPDDVLITDANGSQYNAAIQHPAASVTWIVMNTDPRNDANQVWLALHGRADFQAHFALQKTFGTVQIYEKDVSMEAGP